MKVLFDQRIIDLKSFKIGPYDRAFQYGDGLFETMIWKNEKVQLIKDHFSRIKDGSKILHLKLPGYFNQFYFISNIKKLMTENHLKGDVRIKLFIWRKSGGLYEPVSFDTHHMIDLSQILSQPPKDLRKVGFCQNVYNQKSAWSAFKTQSSLPYVLAGIEKKRNNLDDIIICDEQGFISELLYSNIFWVKDNIFFTPSLDTGCIRGVMRSHLIRKLSILNIQLEEVLAEKNKILQAQHVFSANVTGLRSILSIKNKKFKRLPNLDHLLP